MAFSTYKSVQILTPEPLAGPGGQVLNDNFRSLADSIERMAGKDYLWTACASKCKVNYQTQTGITQVTHKSRHRLSRTVTGIKLVYGNFRAFGGETIGSAVTYTAGIEYPSGTLTQVTFNGGSPSVSIPAGGYVVSDPLMLDFTALDYMWVRTCQTTQSTSDTSFVNLVATSAFGEGSAFGVDRSVSSTITASDGSLIAGPQAILGCSGSVWVPSVALVGDSITNGDGDTAERQRGYAVMALNDEMGYVSVTRASETAAMFQGTGRMRRLRLLESCSHAIVMYGTNDIFGSSSSATTTQNYVLNMGNALRRLGIKAYVCTLPPNTTSTDGWTTETNQTVDATKEGNRTSFNTWAKTTSWDWTEARPYVGYFDVGVTVQGAASGKWAANLTADGTHPNSTATALMAAAVVKSKFYN
jgi:lysophospholipase L1-like esterase